MSVERCRSTVVCRRNRRTHINCFFRRVTCQNYDTNMTFFLLSQTRLTWCTFLKSKVTNILDNLIHYLFFRSTALKKGRIRVMTG